MRLWFVGVLHAVTLHTTSAARADEMTWRLEYRRGADAPSNCPDENDLRTALSAKIGARDPFSKDAPRKITIDVARTTERVEARIQARDEQDNILADSTAYAPSWRCDQLATRIVFVLRDIVDPLSPPTPASSQPSPSQPSSSTPQVKVNDISSEKKDDTVVAKQPIVLTNRPRRSPAHSKPQIALSLGLGATWWNKPNTAFTSALGAGLSWRVISVGMQVRYDYAWTLPVDKPVRADQVGLAAIVCGHQGLWKGRVSLRACLLGEIGRMWIEPNQSRTIDYSSTLVNFVARLGASVPLYRSWSIELYADGIIAAHRPELVLDAHQRWQLPLFNGAFRANVVGQLDVF